MPDRSSPTPDPHAPILQFLSAWIGGRYHRMMEHSAATLAGDPEALHDMRVGSRRLRSAFQNGRGLYRRKRRYRRLEGTIERFTTALGRVRDLDVLIDYLALDSSTAPPNDLAHLRRLLAHLGGRREERRIVMREVLAELSRPRAVARFEQYFAGDRASGDRASQEP
jgi:CHAD domain-containing protein